MPKSADAFRTISEVAEWLQTPAHVLRFWESKFTQVKPVKRAGGRRYYRPSDMELLGGIKRLLHDEGMTIKGVQKMLRDKGIAHVAAMSPALDDLAVPMEAEIVPMPARPAAIPAPTTAEVGQAPSTPVASEAAAIPQITDPTRTTTPETVSPAPKETGSEPPAPTEAVPVVPVSPVTLRLDHVAEDLQDTDFPLQDGVLAALLKRNSPLAPEVAAQVLALSRQLVQVTA